MADISNIMVPRVKLLCARCHRPFTPRTEGQKYGRICAMKLAGQVQLDSMALISKRVLKAIA